MSERRMFAKTIIDSDAFLDMPSSAQALYFHLSMRADDEGFLNNPKKIQKMVNAADDDLKMLIAKRFIIPFESGVVVIKHWRMHNYIQADRFKPTVYQDERNQLSVKGNKSYTMRENVETPTLYPECVQDGDTGKDRLGKDRLDEDSKVKKSIIGTKNQIPPTKEMVREYCTERKNSVDAERFMDHYTTNGWKVGKSKMVDWQSAVRTWERNNTESKPKEDYSF